MESRAWCLKEALKKHTEIAQRAQSEPYCGILGATGWISEEKSAVQIPELGFAIIEDCAANFDPESSSSEIEAELDPAWCYGPIGADTEQKRIEIAASFALEKDDIKAKQNQKPEIKSGDELYLAWAAAQASNFSGKVFASILNFTFT